MVAAVEGPDVRYRTSRLTERQLEVLQLVVDGATVAQVADELGLALKTVKNHLADAYLHLDAPNLTQAVLAGLRAGVLHLDAPLTRDEQFARLLTQLDPDTLRTIAARIETEASRAAPVDTGSFR